MAGPSLTCVLEFGSVPAAPALPGGMERAPDGGRVTGVTSAGAAGVAADVSTDVPWPVGIAVLVSGFAVAEMSCRGDPCDRPERLTIPKLGSVRLREGSSADGGVLVVTLGRLGASNARSTFAVGTVGVNEVLVLGWAVLASGSTDSKFDALKELR